MNINLIFKNIKYALYGGLSLLTFSFLTSFLSMPFFSDGYYIDLIYFIETGNLLDNGKTISGSAPYMVPLSYLFVLLFIYCVYLRKKRKH